MKKIVSASIALATLFVWTSANSAVCDATSPFADVAASESFCSNTEWLKNRGVTVGCAEGTNYCPFDVVTRAQMALFMNRLADAVLPPPMKVEQSFQNKTVNAQSISGTSSPY